jgi:hypothetical protein
MCTPVPAPASRRACAQSAATSSTGGSVRSGGSCCPARARRPGVEVARSLRSSRSSAGASGGSLSRARAAVSAGSAWRTAARSAPAVAVTTMRLPSASSAATAPATAVASKSSRTTRVWSRIAVTIDPGSSAGRRGDGGRSATDAARASASLRSPGGGAPALIERRICACADSVARSDPAAARRSTKTARSASSSPFWFVGPTSSTWSPPNAAAERQRHPSYRGRRQDVAPHTARPAICGQLNGPLAAVSGHLIV